MIEDVRSLFRPQLRLPAWTRTDRCHNDRRVAEAFAVASDSVVLSSPTLDSDLDVEAVGSRRRHDSIEVRDDITNRGSMQLI